MSNPSVTTETISFGDKKARRKEYPIFISHSWDYDEEYKRMVELLESKSYFKFRNYSVPEHDDLDTTSDLELKVELRKQIDPASVVIVLAGMYVNHSRWIKKEIEIAESKDKPILGVKPHGNERVPEYVQDHSDDVVGWTGISVVKAIRELAK